MSLGIFLANLFFLFFIYQIKHFLADYIFQNGITFMLGKFKKGWGWILPLTAHVAVHGVMTAGIAFWVGRGDIALSLALFDMIVHFGMDRLKASPNLLGRYKGLSAPEYYALMGGKEIAIDKDGLPYLENITPEKAKKKLRDNTIFWNAVGFDQLVHHLTHYILIAKIIGLI